MFPVQHHALGMHVAVDHLTISQHAAKAVEHQQAVRERKLEHKAQRQHRRAARRGQEAYTTAV
ncbi:MAG: hypothetical protein L0H41_16340 [Microlunatus sp.]|nr:hypothetical protein [Microlunatus sp.]MDN5771385.1 hypothetical protein [Microlunatus sp.]MDN5804163.1 hypothetical protein [Microlunatus sp.]